MSYAHVVANIIDATRDDLPGAGQRLDTGQWVSGLPVASVAVQQACGWFAVTDTARPADTATDTFDRAIQNVSGTWTVVWTQRAKTAAESTAATNDANRQTIVGQAQAALGANTTYLAIGAPTNAQVVAQVRALTQQVNKLIRLAINQLDAVT